MNYQTLENLASSIGSTVICGAILAFLFFLIKEKCFPLPNVTGRWHVEMRTVKTAYNPYQHMVLQYVAMLWREGSKIKGTAEKVYENSSTGKRNYVGQNRTRGEIEGYIDKRYFSKDQVSLHIIEDGHGRQSTHFLNLLVEKGGHMTGTFSSMVADSEGEVTCQRKPFSDSDS